MIDVFSKLDEDIRLRGLSVRTHEAYLDNVRRYLNFLGDIPCMARPDGTGNLQKWYRCSPEVVPL